MPSRFMVGPRFELFLALAEMLRPNGDGALWPSQVRHKFDQAIRRRMGDLALGPAIWPVLAAVPETAALDGDSDAVIRALADLPADDFARRCRAAARGAPRDPALARLLERLDADPAALQQAAVEALRRFDRLVFAAFWRRARPDLEQRARDGAESPADSAGAIVFPSLFGAHRFQFGHVLVLTVPGVQPTTLPSPSLPPPSLPSAGSNPEPEPIFRALGDATRYAIARLIASEALTGADLARRIGVSGPTLTHHLKHLRQARLVIEERRGNSVLLRLDRRVIEMLSAAALESLFAGPPVAIRRSRRG